MVDELFPRPKKKRGPNQHTKDQREAAATISQDAIKIVFDYWKERHSKRAAVLDAKRAARIGWAIKNYGIDVCKDAIEGCLVSDWHMGKNPNGKKYNDIHNIFIDAQHVEMFLRKLEEKTGNSARDEWIGGGG
ncbi:MAG: hypothetical protein ACKN9V_06910 [Pseudomonadota bacterium]